MRNQTTQQQRILEILENARGGWIDGMSFLRLSHPITQFHSVIWNLQKRGYKIEGRFIYGKNWKEYRLKHEIIPPAQINITNQSKLNGQLL